MTGGPGVRGSFARVDFLAMEPSRPNDAGTVASSAADHDA